MKIYLDYILLINFSFDFILLFCVATILRRNIKLKNIILGALFGSLTTFILFLKVNSIQLFLIKLITSIIMVNITFKYKNFKYFFKNIIYLYIVSMFLGGTLYFLNIESSYKHNGLVFYHSGLSINVIILLIITPIIIYTYIKQLLDLKLNYSLYYKVDIKYNNQLLKLNAYLDTGNRLYDPISNIPIIIISKREIQNVTKYKLIPYSTISESNLIKCIKPDYIKINNKIITKNVLIGLVEKIEMEGGGCILNPTIIENL